MVKNLRKRILTSLFLFLLFFLIFINNFFLIYSLIVLGVFSIIEFSSLMKKINKNILYFTINNFYLFRIYLFFCFYFLFISNSLNLKIILYILLLVCIASDLGGFIFGKIFKGPKLTKISPKKTIIGSIGSIILSCLVILILFSYITQVINFKLFY